MIVILSLLAFVIVLPIALLRLRVVLTLRRLRRMARELKR